MSKDIGRNDPCWCGSGRKYKRCHLRQDEEQRRQQAESSSNEENAAGPGGQGSFFGEEMDEEDLRWMAQRYEVRRGPAPEEWLSYDELEQHQYVAAYHEVEQPHPTPEKPRLHYVIHSVVENQIAGGEEIVTETMERLVEEGLTRHEAVHAVGGVISRYIFALMNGEAEEDDEVQELPEKYHRQLEELTARKWLG